MSGGVRIAHRFATYRGDQVEQLLADPVKGTNAFGELMVVVDATYDPDTDSTRAGFAWATDQDAADAMENPNTNPLGAARVTAWLDARFARAAQRGGAA